MNGEMLKALIERAKALLLKPAETWDAIALEETDVPKLYRTWIIPLAAITPIAALIGYAVIGAGFGARLPIANALSFAVVWFVLTLASVYVMAYIIDALAPYFDAPKDFKAAFKLSAYFPTAGWIAGVFWLLPPLSWLAIVGAYSFYLLFVGLPKLMKPPVEKAGGFTLAAIGAAVVVYFAVGIIASTMLSSGYDGRADLRNDRSTTRDARDDARGARDTAGKTPTSPEEALGAALGSMLGGGTDGPVVQADALERLPPNRLVGLNRRSISVEETDVPFRGVQLTAEYGEPGERRLTLSIVNSPALPTMMGFLGMAAADAEEETDDSYVRITEEGDDIIVEEWDESTKTGRYGRTLGGVFMIDAEGYDVEVRDLRRAVNEFSLRELERLPTNE